MKYILFIALQFQFANVYSQSIFLSGTLVNISSTLKADNFPKNVNIISGVDLGLKLDLKKQWSILISVGKFQLTNNELNYTYFSNAHIKNKYLGTKIGLNKSFKLSSKSIYYVEGGIALFNNYIQTEEIENPKIINRLTKNGNEFSVYSKLGVVVKLSNKINFDFSLFGQEGINSNVIINNKKVKTKISNISTTLYYKL